MNSPTLQDLEPIGVRCAPFHPPGILGSERVLIRFEGDRLTAYSVVGKELEVLRLWMDCDNNTERWAVFVVDRSVLGGYLQRKKTLRDVVLAADGWVYVVDIGKPPLLEWYHRTSRFRPAEFPPQYLPKEDSWFDEELSLT